MIERLYQHITKAEQACPTGLITPTPHMPIPFDPAGPEKDMRNQRHAAQIEVA